MMSTQEGSSQTSERSLDRAVMTIDLAAILGSLKQEPSWRVAKRNAMTLVKQPVFRVVLVALQSGTAVGAHEVDGPVTIQAIEGELAIQVDGEVVVLAAGQLLILRSGLRHSMQAKADSAFLLTLAGDGTHPVELVTPADG
jgi:quercetin dioxygenase-like cupin family protein